MQAVRHLGYVQIDTIHVIERSHHHILHSRIPDYRREHLRQAQSVDKTVFEYWTHALAYVSTEDLRYFVRSMRRYGAHRDTWFKGVTDEEVRRVVARIRREGALTIRDINDDVLVEKHHAWGSRKPSKRALQLAFFKGLIAVSERAGMLKTYELIGRHFGWPRPPAAATVRETLDYFIDRALRTQALVSLDSICFLNAPIKSAVKRLIEQRVRQGDLLPVTFQGAQKPHWARPETLERIPQSDDELVHILSPFDPLVAQRQRLQQFFDYEHRFEAYVPKHKRVFGYFVCPVLVGDQVVAALDLKTDREARTLRVQQWNWVGAGKARRHKKPIEQALRIFEEFQLATLDSSAVE